VAAPLGLVEVGEDLVGEVVKPTGGERLGSSALPVGPGRRGPGAGQPVQAEVVQDVVAGETPVGWPSTKAPKPLALNASTLGGVDLTIDPQGKGDEGNEPTGSDDVP
jgi:hypothetical protein